MVITRVINGETHKIPLLPDEIEKIHQIKKDENLFHDIRCTLEELKSDETCVFKNSIDYLQNIDFYEDVKYRLNKMDFDNSDIRYAIEDRLVVDGNSLNTEYINKYKGLYEDNLELSEIEDIQASDVEEVQEFDFDMGMTFGM